MQLCKQRCLSNWDGHDQVGNEAKKMPHRHTSVVWSVHKEMGLSVCGSNIPTVYRPNRLLEKGVISLG